MSREHQNSTLKHKQQKFPSIKLNDSANSKYSCLCQFCKISISNPKEQLPTIINKCNIKEDINIQLKFSIVNLLDEIEKHSGQCLPHLPILDTVVFNNDGTMKYIVSYEQGRLKLYKTVINLQNYILQKKHQYDLQYQKWYHHKQNSKIQKKERNKENEKHLKLFQTNIKLMNPILNRIAIVKNKYKQYQDIYTQKQINLMFSKAKRNINDFIRIQYLQIFPIMYGHQQSSFIHEILYCRKKQINSKNFKTADYYVGNWYSQNQTIASLEKHFLKSISNKQQLLMYYTYKLMIFFQKISNKRIEHATLYFITNDRGENYLLKNIKCDKIEHLPEIQGRKKQLPKKLQNSPNIQNFNLKKQMREVFNNCKQKFSIIQKQYQQWEQLKLDNIHISNSIFQNIGFKLPQKYQKSSFIKFIQDQHSHGRKRRLNTTCL